MEDVLDVYQRSYDPSRPVVCIDETNKQLIIENGFPVSQGNQKNWILFMSGMELQISL